MALLGVKFTVDVPWGQIEGQEWGDPEGHPWVGVHGWLDSSASLVPIVKQFPKKGHRFLLMDLPGHGHSSNYPQGNSGHK